MVRTSDLQARDHDRRAVDFASLYSSGAIVHEVGNILTPAALLLEASLEPGANEQLRTDALEAALKGIQHAREISETLLNLYTDAAKSSWCSINDVLHDLRTTLHMLPHGKHASIVMRDATDFECSMNHTALFRVLSNLVSNALQVSSGSASIVISARAVTPTPRWFHVEHPDYNDLVRVSVSDTGPGIEPKDLHSIFEPTYTKRSEGHGLGLHICKQLVDSSGGRITVESTVGLGTTFGIELPARR